MSKNRKVPASAMVIVPILVIMVVAAIFAVTTLFAKQEVAMGDPADIVLDLYNPWLEAVHATSTDPYQEKLNEWPYLGKELRKKIDTAKRTEGAVDPVLCQTNPPESITLRRVHQSEETSEVVITARKSTSTQQAVVTLTAKDNGWYISDIRCTPGEVAPEREFSFDMEGFLLKSVPEPLNPEYWHLVFEEAGNPGHHVPLFFSAESVCTNVKGVAGACEPEIFVEAMKAHVQGQMTELGVNVSRLQLKK